MGNLIIGDAAFYFAVPVAPEVHIDVILAEIVAVGIENKAVFFLILNTEFSADVPGIPVLGVQRILGIMIAVP